MHEMTSCLPVRSLGIFIGTGACDAHCAHCAGIPHRKYAPRQDGIIDDDLVRRTLEDCYARGARSLSITSSGEPTLSPRSVTRALSLVDDLKAKGAVYSSIHVYTNGIRIGTDEDFCKEYLPCWKTMGLDTLYITVHDIDERKNAMVYGVASYPSIRTVFSRAHDAGLAVRANMMLGKNTVHTLDGFVSSVEYLQSIGADRIAAWPVRGLDDRPDAALGPSLEEFERIGAWVREQGIAYKVSLSGEESRSLYASGQKLTLFPDGTLSSEWCNSAK